MESSIIGSIGVITSGFGAVEAIKKIGIERRVYSQGRNKGLLDPFLPEKKDDVKQILTIQKDLHSQFIAWVKKRRGKRLKANDEVLFNAGVWSGSKAKELGLIDGIGDYYNVMKNIFGDDIKFKDFSKKTSASPKVRKFARELGVDISKVEGSERLGRVTESDVKSFVANKPERNSQKEFKKDETIELEYPHSEFGKTEIKDIPRVKRLSSKYLMNSWTNIPHVTNHDEADITELEEFRTSLTDIYTGEKKKITPLAFIVKALTASLKKFPNFNSSIDEIDKGKMTLKKYYHIGIAVDKKHGLMVPKLRNADNKNISLIGNELKKLSDQCRSLKIDKKELFGGSMTITSLGGIGGSFFTPIINYPEVAILGVGKSQKKQIFIDGKFITRTMLPLSLSYDHRIIDGAEAARFNNDLKDNMGKNFAYKLAV